MHEYGIIAELVDKLATELWAAHVPHVEYVHLRTGVEICEDVVREVFGACGRGTPLEGAKLVVDAADVTLHCACGYQDTQSVEGFSGHFWICPKCATVHSLEGVPDLEVVEVVAKT